MKKIKFIIIFDICLSIITIIISVLGIISIVNVNNIEEKNYKYESNIKFNAVEHLEKKFDGLENIVFQQVYLLSREKDISFYDAFEEYTGIEYYDYYHIDKADGTRRSEQEIDMIYLLYMQDPYNFIKNIEKFGREFYFDD